MSNPPPYNPPYNSASHPIAPRPSNGLGIAAFIVSLIGIPVCFLAPVALLLSFIALFKAPPGFAFAGFVISFVVTAFLALVISFFGWSFFTMFRYGKPYFSTVITAQELRRDITRNNAGASPDDITGNVEAAAERDGWGRPYRYRKVGNTGFELRSAGHDGTFDTDDDYTEIFDVTQAAP